MRKLWSKALLFLCAGAALFCEKLEGDYYNVMGLPVCRLYETLCRTVPEVMEDTI